MPFLSVPEAAQLLGVRPERVRALLRSGALEGERVGGRWLLPRDSVEQRRARGTRPGRPMSPRVARAMVDLVGQHLGEEPGQAWLDLAQPHQSRLRRRWEKLVDSDDSPGLMRAWLPNRCRAERFSYPGDAMEVFDDPRLAAGGTAHTALGLSGGAVVEPHVADAHRQHVVEDLLLVNDPRGNVLLRSEPVVRVDLAACLADVADLGGGRNDTVVAHVLAEQVLR